MDKLSDDQRWVYPHWHPWFNQSPFRRFMPFPGRPMGDESYRHATIVSIMGRGPKGAKGDMFKYEDLTDAQIAQLAEHFGKVLITRNSREYEINSSSNKRLKVTNMGIDWDNSFIYVYINGLMTYDFEIIHEEVDGVNEDFIEFYPSDEERSITIESGMRNFVEVEALTATVSEDPNSAA